ncbi:hypothetical protein Tco_0123274 [Tanacetum coccineum]
MVSKLKFIDVLQAKVVLDLTDASARNMLRSQEIVVEANSRGHVRFGKWASIFMIVWFNLAPSEVAPSVSGTVAGLVLLLRYGISDSGPNMCFNTSASPEYMSGLDRASLAKVVGHVSPLDAPASLVKYNVPRDLHPWLPDLNFVMSKLPDDAIGIYHRMFDLSGVRIPFSAFILSVIKHFQVHFSQLGPLGLNKRTIPHYISWRHLDSAISDPKPSAGSYSQFWRLPFYCTPPTASNAAIPTPTLKDLAAATPNSKVLAKAEYSKKQRAYTSRAASSQVAKHTRSATGHSSKGSAQTALFDDNQSDDEESEDNDDDACYESPIIIPIRSVATIPTRGNLGGGVVPSVAECPSTRRHSRGMAVMDDAVVTSTRSVGRSQSFTGPIPVSRDHTCDDIDRDFFPFAPGPYYATYPKDGVVASSYEVSCEEWNGPHQPTLTVLTKEIFKDPHVYECSSLFDVVLLARYRDLLKSHHEYALSADSRLKGLQQRLTSFQGLESQVSGLNKQVADLNDKVTASDAAFVKAKAKGKERKKKIKSLSKTLDQFTAKVACLATDLNQVQGELLSLTVSASFECGFKMDQTSEQLDVALKNISHFVPDAQKIVDHADHPLSVLLELEPGKLAPFLVENEDWVRTMVDTPDVDMVDAASTKSTERKKVVPPSLDVLVTIRDAAAAPLGFNLVMWGFFISFVHDRGGARGMLENTVCCSELRGTPTVDVWLSI